MRAPLVAMEKSRQAPFLAGTMETFGPASALGGTSGAESGRRRRVRVLMIDGAGLPVDEVVITEEAVEPVKMRVPLAAKRGDLVFEEAGPDGAWCEYRRDSVPVRRLALGHGKRLYEKILRDAGIFVAKAGWFVLRKAISICPSLVRCALSGAWRRFAAGAEEHGPRRAWTEGLGKFSRQRIWAYVYAGKECIGQLYQYTPREEVAFDPFPMISPANGPLPKLTVVTPSFNQGRFLGDTMDSVLQEGPFEVDYIVMDGGSKDESAEVIRKRGEKLKHWQSKPDKGQAAAIREGFEHTDCGPDDIMAYLNSDDLFCPGAVGFVLDWFARNPEVDAVYGHRIIIDDLGREVGRWVLPPHDPEVLGMVDFVPQETLFWRRRIHDAIGGFDPSFQFAMDWDFLLRLRRAGARIERLPWFLGCFRVHPDQKTHTSIDSVGAREVELLRRRENEGRDISPRTLHEAVVKTQVESNWYAEKLRAGIRI